MKKLNRTQSISLYKYLFEICQLFALNISHNLRLHASASKYKSNVWFWFCIDYLYVIWYIARVYHVYFTRYIFMDRFKWIFLLIVGTVACLSWSLYCLIFFNLIKFGSC